MDIATLLGLLIGFGGILLGNAMEGGHFRSLTQLAAAFIVFGGTFGATMVSHSFEDFKRGLRMLSWAFRSDQDPEARSKWCAQVVGCAKVARRDTILALEKEIPRLSHPHLKQMVRMLIDGVDGKTLRNVFEHRIEVEERRQLAAAKVWSDAGGYAPTIGIIGAVIGLIHVMSNLVDTSALGQGIAIAFVATIYGVASANLFFLPVANKIKRKILAQSEDQEMLLEGVVAIAQGMSPMIVEEKMKCYFERES